MQKLDLDQKKFVDNQLLEVENQIIKIQSMITEDCSAMKKDFLTLQIKQLNVVRDSLLKMKDNG